MHPTQKNIFHILLRRWKEPSRRSFRRASLLQAGLCAGLCLSAFALKAGATGHTQLNGAQPRPFWAFAHNPNDLDAVKNALENGCNALEPDVSEITCGGEEVLIDFDTDLGVSDCGQIRFLDWCDGVNALAQQFPKLAYVVFDIKGWASNPGTDAQVKKNAAEILMGARTRLNANGVHLNVTYSAASVADAAILDEIIKTPLLDNEGVQIDGDDDAAPVVQHFFDLGFFGNIGFGDGTIGQGPNLPRIMDRAAYLRASIGFPKAVTYVYTLSEEASMHSFINGGVDGIITTDGSQTDLQDVIATHPEIKLATVSDNPFGELNEAYGIEFLTGDNGTDADIQLTLNGCKGSATIRVDAGFIIPALYNSHRFESGFSDWVTIPSKDLGDIQSITINNLGGGNLPKWQVAEVHVSSARFLGPNFFSGGQPTREYSSSAVTDFESGDVKTLSLSRNFTAPAPTIECPAAIITSNDIDQCGATVHFAPAVSGFCDDVTAVCNPPSGSFFPIGVSTVTCFAQSASSGQSVPCTFNVTVVNIQAPTIQCPAPISVANTHGECGAQVSFSPTVNGPCDDVVAICNPPSGSHFPVGVTTVNCYAKGSTGPQSAPCSFTVTVSDTEAPVVICPPPLSVKATGPTGALVNFAASATDNCGSTNLAYSKNPGTIFAIGDTLVITTATDSHNNHSSCSFNVHVKGAAEQTADLLTFVSNLNGPNNGIKNSLLTKLNKAIDDLAKNKLNNACNDLNAFINEVSAQAGKSITAGDAAYIIAAANQIRAVIGCN
ncbi:MAG: hypothetical protein JWM99_3519 [Verrucomicrobiales bacterium]|nr:hypothetical protein [Verrucomicrobiales bacterium]